MRLRLLLFLLTISPLAAAQQSGGSLPGGLLFPMLGSAALTNAAALTADWMYKAQAFYSPPASEAEPQSYLFGFAKASERFGFNIGYSGSTHMGESMHNAFAAIATKVGPLSIGASAKRLDLAGASPFTFDVSAIYHVARKLRFGFVSYDIGNSKQTAIGIGFGKPYAFTLDVDMLLPSKFSEEEVSTEYAASSAITFYLGRLGFAAGVRYSQMPYEQTDQKVSGNLGLLLQVSKSWSIVAIGNSYPQTFSIGLTWTDLPTTQQYINFFQSRNRRK